MNISQSDVANLQSVITIQLDKSDFAPQVAETLKKYRSTANVPGFRKGHVPMGLIKKQYEKPLMYEEINKILGKELNQFLVDNEVNMLGEPIARTKDELNFDEDQFTFEFDIAHAPEVDLNLDSVQKPHYQIQLEEDTVDNIVNDMRKSFGELQAVDTVDERATIDAVMHVLNEDDEINEKQDVIHVKFSVADLQDKDKFIGKKVDDRVQLPFAELFAESFDVENELGLDEADLPKGKVSVKIDKIESMGDAEMNQEFFDKVVGKDKVSSEEELRNFIHEENSKIAGRDSQFMAVRLMMDHLMENVEMEFPKDLLLKTIRMRSEQEMSEEEAEKVYEQSLPGLRYQLIENELSKKFNIQVTQEEMKEVFRQNTINQFRQYGLPEENMDEMVDGMLPRLMENEGEMRKVGEQLLMTKLFDNFEQNGNFEKKNISNTEFVEIIENLNKK
ncbi:MAG: trigger factor [Weeksellaceae bacterium]|nr:trigger factor [Weeksellaceae bacterium]